MKTLIDWLIGCPSALLGTSTGSRLFLRDWSSAGCFSGAGGANSPICRRSTENFASWGIPFPHILTPFVSGVEFFGGIFLLLGLMTRVSAGARSV